MTESDSLTEGLRAAVEAVEAAGVPEDLREIAFTRALDATLGIAVPMSPAPPGTTQIAPPTPGSGQTSAANTGGAMAKLAAKLGIDASTAAKVYDIDADGLHLVLAPSMFNSKVTAAMEEIARLVVAGRQGAGLDEEWTSCQEIRALCENRGRYSSSNFATYVAKLDGDGFRIKGTGKSKELKANATGFENTGQLVTRLAGPE